MSTSATNTIAEAIEGAQPDLRVAELLALLERGVPLVILSLARDLDAANVRFTHWVGEQVENANEKALQDPTKQRGFAVLVDCSCFSHILNTLGRKRLVPSLHTVAVTCSNVKRLSILEKARCSCWWLKRARPRAGMEFASGEETPAAEEEDEAAQALAKRRRVALRARKRGTRRRRRQAKAAAKREGEAALVQAAWTSILELREAKLKEEEEGQNEQKEDDEGLAQREEDEGQADEGLAQEEEGQREEDEGQADEGLAQEEEGQRDANPQDGQAGQDDDEGQEEEESPTRGVLWDGVETADEAWGVAVAEGQEDDDDGLPHGLRQKLLADEGQEDDEGQDDEGQRLQKEEEEGQEKEKEGRSKQKEEDEGQRSLPADSLELVSVEGEEIWAVAN